MQAALRSCSRVVRLFGISGLLFSLASPLATAALLSQDDAILGQDTVTLDTQTNLHWLDLDLSANLSWNAAANTYAAFGFRHAT